MGTLADQDAQDLLRAKFGSTAPGTKPTSLLVCLSSTQPTLSGGVIGNVTEPTTGAYARQSVPNDNANWTITGRAVSNVTAVEFDVDASTGWNVQPAWALLADTAGRYIGWGALGVTATGAAGTKVILAPGAVTVTITTG